MFNMLSLEYFKFRKNPTIRLLLVFFILFFPLGYLMIVEIKDLLPDFIPNKDALIKFPEVWRYMGHGGTYLVFFFLGAIMIYIVGMEARFKTMRQSIINGNTRNEFFLSKLYVLVTLSIIATLYYTLVCFIIGSIHSDSAYELFPENLIIFKFFLMCMGYLGFGMMLVFLTRNSGLALLLYFSYVLIVERILVYFIHTISSPYKLENAYPTETIDNLIPNPIFEMASNLASKGKESAKLIDFTDSLLPVICYICLFIGIAYLSFKKRDL